MLTSAHQLLPCVHVAVQVWIVYAEQMAEYERQKASNVAPQTQNAAA